MTKEELVQQLRRQGKGSNQNSSRYRGVTKHQKGKWEARIGQVVGRKYKYLGLYLTEKEAAIAYDRAAVAARGMSAQTNFEITNYVELLSMPLLDSLFRLHFVLFRLYIEIVTECAAVAMSFWCVLHPGMAQSSCRQAAMIPIGNRSQLPACKSCKALDGIGPRRLLAAFCIILCFDDCYVVEYFQQPGITATDACRRRGPEDTARPAGS